MSKLILVGLVEPVSEAAKPEFDEWYLNNHIEDTAHCPGVNSATTYEFVETPGTADYPRMSQYLTVYDFDLTDAAEAERVLGEYQNDPNAYPRRVPPTPAWPVHESMKVIGRGWYQRERGFSVPK